VQRRDPDAELFGDFLVRLAVGSEFTSTGHVNFDTRPSELGTSADGSLQAGARPLD